MRSWLLVLLLFGWILLYAALGLQQAAGKVSAAPTSGLIGYWKFDETAGATAADSGGAGHKGAISGAPTWVSGKYNNALSFNGSNNQVNLPDAAALSPGAGQFTISTWIKPKTISSATQSIWTDYSGDAGKTAQVLITIDGSTKKVRCVFRDLNAVWVPLDSTVNLVSGVWYHVAAVRNGKTVTLYINGAKNVAADSGNGILGNINTLGSQGPIIGGNIWGGSAFNGLIDEVRAYNRALSAQEISDLYNAASVSPTPTPTPTPTVIAGGMGMNIGAINDYSPQLEFVDLMKKSREWIVGSDNIWDAGVKAPLNSNGYPLQIPYSDPVKGPVYVKTLIADAIGGRYPAGSYTLIIKGSGTVRLDFDARGTYTGPGAFIVPVTPTNNGIFLAIIQSDPASPITEINFVMPGYENTFRTSPFYPTFISRLRGMKAVRFMEPMLVNGSPVAQWADRTPFSYFTQTRSTGIAPEYIADIANAIGADAWVNIPHMADDGYVIQLAQLLKSRLSPTLKVYLEYSNEIWNSSFSQAQYAEQKGAALFPQDATGAFGQRLKYQARRSGEIFALFEQVFGGTSRLVRVISSQAANSWTGDFLLQGLEDPVINPGRKKADALSIAPYFGDEIADAIGDAGAINSTTIDSILNSAEADIPTQFVQRVSGNKTVANAHTVRLIAYEGGQHLVSANWNYQNNQTLTTKLTAVNRDPRMGVIYNRMFTAWYALNNDLFMAYSYVGGYSRYGSWGALEWQDEAVESAPKFKAITDFLAYP